MNSVSNMFREFTMNYVEGYRDLPNCLKDLFDCTYKKHLSSITENKRYPYTENYLEKVEGEKTIIKVYFKNGDYFLYLPKNKWIKVNDDEQVGAVYG